MGAARPLFLTPPKHENREKILFIFIISSVSQKSTGPVQNMTRPMPLHYTCVMASHRMIALFLMCLCLAFPCPGQESIDTLLDRGYVAHWLVCGPFAPDVEGGIGAALARGDAPLGDRDFMAPVGGVARVRPEHLLVVETTGGEAMWQRAGAQDEALDLAPFYPDSKEGISYAAFYARSTGRTLAFIDLQTPLGARVWFNGFPLRDIAAAPVAAAGVDRFAVVFRPGDNLLLLELPGARFEVLAQAAGMSVCAFGARGLANRPLLKGNSGFEFALSIRPAFPAGPLIYVPQLKNTGDFSGTRFDVRQDVELTLFNPTDNPVGPVDVSITVPDSRAPLLRHIPLVPPQSDWRETFGIPTGQAIPGQRIRTVVQLDTGGKQTRFKTAVTVLKRAKGGKVFLVTGRRYTPETAEDQAARTDRRALSFARQAVLAEREPEYGFDLGFVPDWQAALVASPGIRETLLDSVGRGRSASRLGMADVDERLVSGEVLLRNLVYGLTAAERRLGDLRPVYDRDGLPAIAPQTPQLLAMAGAPGLLGAVDVGGVPGLFLHESPGGAHGWHRRREAVTGPTTLAELRRLASLQRREMLSLGVEADVMLSASVVPPPEPFYLGAAAKLAQAYPPILFRGGGSRDFFDALGYLSVETRQALPRSSRLLTRAWPGDIVSQPALKDAYWRVERRLLMAERFATFAGLLGAAYPDAPLDLAWRQLLLHGTPGTLGFSARQQDYVDTLAALREAADWSDEVLGGATGFLARTANTLEDMPLTPEGIQAVVVFNPAAHARSDVCTVTIPLDDAPGFSLEDREGNRIPFVVDDLRTVKGTVIRSIRVRFVARDVPGVGYKTYYALPTGTLPRPVTTQDLQIENDTWLLMADPDTGDITSFSRKATGENFVSGAANRVVALEEDADKTAGGRGIWTNGREVVAGPGLTRIETRITDWMQELTVTAPMGSGTLVRRMTLYTGLPGLYCETRLEGAGLNQHLLALSNALPRPGRAPVYGERFAAITARCCAHARVLRSDASGNPSGCAVQPALEWVSLGPSDQIQVGGDGVFPLVPTAVIHGKDPQLVAAAHAVQRAFTDRGIPAWTWPGTPPRRDAPWSDSTEFTNYDDDLDTGASMRVIVGGPRQNPYCAELFARAAPDAVRLLTERLATGASLFLLDRRAGKDRPPVPTLVFAGLTEAKSGALARDLARAIASRGIFVIPPSSSTAGVPEPRATTGMALLFSGTRLCNTSYKGNLLLCLARLGKEPGGFVPEKHAFSYVFRPYDGSWRDAQVPQAAHAFNLPLQAVVTEPTRGTQAAEQTFLSTDEPGFLFSAIKPAGYSVAAGIGTPVSALNGLVVRGWESTGRPWSGHVSSFAPLRSVMAARFREDPGESLNILGKRFSYTADPFALSGLWLLPEAPPLRGAPEAIARTKPAFGALHTRYWRHNPGAAPMGGMPISLLLRGDLGKDTSQVNVTVANLLTDQPVQGTVTIAASAGWSVGPEDFDYRLDPGETLDENLVVLRTADARGAGGIEVRTTWRGQVYRDVMEEAEAPLSLEVRRNGGQIRVTIKNRGGIPAEGYLDLVTAPVLWPELGRPAKLNVLPRRAAVNVPPFRAQDVLFRFSDPEATPWAVAKLAANGHVVYASVPQTAE